MEYMNQEICLERQKVMEERLGRDKERLERLEKLYDAINIQNTNIEKLVIELRHINSSLSSHEERITAIEEQPRGRLSHIVSSMISALTGGIITVILSQIFI
ncbi:MAG: hypothetical protein E7665_05500 [Ruminococcaceae bacterium]|nr:hypothetical protein [Oscillospiraceae bacterium]